jgi:hypothetical protein
MTNSMHPGDLLADAETIALLRNVQRTLGEALASVGPPA